MQNWELPHIWKWRENWLFQCRWILRSLQISVWSYFMLLSFLSWPGDPCSTQQWRFGERKQKDRDGWLETWAFLQKKRTDIGLWLVAKLQNEKKLGIISDPTFPTEFFWKNKRDWFLYGYIQCDLVVPDELKAKISNFSPIFRNTEVERNDIGNICKNMPKKMIFLSILSEWKCPVVN